MASADAIVRSLLGHGVREAVLAPGSRSGPLALALHEADRHGLLRLHVRVDERTAGFLALGMAKASHRPVPVITTSGTAVANLHPAVLEAKHSGVRLVVVSADRPGRLRGTGANQTTNQVRIFGDIAYAGMEAGDEAGDVITQLLAVCPQAPAHLNVGFDEPLIAVRTEVAEVGAPPVGVDERGGDSAESATLLTTEAKTVVVAGDNAPQAARRLAEEAHWPLFAEPSSGARTGNNAIAPYRLLLQHSPLTADIERVVVFGHPTLSRPITALLAREDLDIVVVGPDLGGFPNRGEHVRRFAAAAVNSPGDPAWLDAWLNQATTVDQVIGALIDQSPFGGYAIAREVGAAVQPGGLLYVGSSNAIRDLDLVGMPAPVGERRITLANRGLAGIDGTLSSAIGAALARPSTSAHAYVGDLTFLHDANGLLIGPDEPRPDLRIVVASDDGGSIFTTLEQGSAGYADAFERVYATATGADIGALCRAYAIDHTAVTTHEELRAALRAPVRGIRVIEARISRAERREFESRLSAAVRLSVRYS